MNEGCVVLLDLPDRGPYYLIDKRPEDNLVKYGKGGKRADKEEKSDGGITIGVSI
jgi:hypothetical protein